MIFLAFPSPIDSETPELEFGQRRGLLQLIHVAGDERDDSFRVRHGATGFCHLCINVTDLEGALTRMQSMGVTVLEPGTTEQGYAVIADPDGYSLQLLFCQIDQSRALKRQLEKIITSSSRDSASRLLTADMDGIDWTDATDGCLPPPPGMPALSHFRGGSPNYQHPHWSKGGAAGGSPLAPASPISTQFAAPAVQSTDPTANGGLGQLMPGRSELNGFEDLQASTSASASSTAYSNGSNNGSGSIKCIPGQPTVRLTGFTSHQAKFGRQNAPKKIDLASGNTRPPLSIRRKTAPNTLFRTLSSYAKSVGNSEANVDSQSQYNTHRSLPSSPNGTREKVAVTTAGSTSYFLQRRSPTNSASHRGPGTPAVRKLRDRLPFMGTKQKFVHSNDDESRE